MGIKRRFPTPAPVKRGNIMRRKFGSVPKTTFNDNVEEYIYNLPVDQMSYAELVCRWITPYLKTEFQVFRKTVKLMPEYEQLPGNMVRVTGLLLSVISKDNRPFHKKIDGPRGVWYGKIKFVVKGRI